ncbi:MAG: DsbA family protein [Gemmatimonadales bacterium]|jgi:protein-disulfide isomerase
MAARRPMRAFYLTLGIIAVLGAFLIVRQSGLLRPSRSVTETLASAPVAPMAGVAATGHVIGSDSAPVEIVEFADFECPSCARFAILEWPEVQQRLLPSGRLKWRFMDFPLQGHTASPPAHLAAGCAGEQGRFFEMMDAIFNRQNEWANEGNPARKIRDYASQLGLDMSRFDACVETAHAKPAVDADYAEGERLGVNATPTFFVNGREWPGVLNYDQIQAIVDSLAPVGGAKPATPPARRK